MDEIKKYFIVGILFLFFISNVLAYGVSLEEAEEISYSQQIVQTIDSDQRIHYYKIPVYNSDMIRINITQDVAAEKVTPEFLGVSCSTLWGFGEKLDVLVDAHQIWVDIYLREGENETLSVVGEGNEHPFNWDQIKKSVGDCGEEKFEQRLIVSEDGYVYFSLGSVNRSIGYAIKEEYCRWAIGLDYYKDCMHNIGSSDIVAEDYQEKSKALYDQLLITPPITYTFSVDSSCPIGEPGEDKVCSVKDGEWVWDMVVVEGTDEEIKASECDGCLVRHSTYHQDWHDKCYAIGSWVVAKKYSNAGDYNLYCGEDGKLKDYKEKKEECSYDYECGKDCKYFSQLYCDDESAEMKCYFGKCARGFFSGLMYKVFG